MQWILDNKEWLFSGIGVAIISSIIAIVISSARRKNKSIQNTISNTTASGDEPKSRPVLNDGPSVENGLTLSKVFADIYNQPPYLQDQAEKNYLGVRIRFSGKLRSLWKQENDIVSITVEPSTESMITVGFEVDIKEFPEFKVMRRGTPLIVEGALTKIGISTKLSDIIIIK